MNALLKITATSDSPKKDYNELVLTQDFVIVRHWAICYRNLKVTRDTPEETYVPRSAFLRGGEAVSMVTTCFGVDVTNRLLGHIRKDYLSRFPNNILKHIASYLGTIDIINLNQVSGIVHCG